MPLPVLLAVAVCVGVGDLDGVAVIVGDVLDEALLVGVLLGVPVAVSVGVFDGVLVPLPVLLDVGV